MTTTSHSVIGDQRINCSARIVLDDGTEVDFHGLGETKIGQWLKMGVRQVKPGHIRYFLHNTGAPQFAGNQPQPGVVVKFRGFWFGAPKGWTVEYGIDRKIDRMFEWDGKDVYRACDETTYHSTVHGQPDSTRWHVLMGGEQLWIDVQDLGQVEGDVPDPALGLPYAEGIFGWDKGYDPTKYPDLERLRSLYTKGAASLSLQSTERDLGWWLLWAAERHSANADGSTRLPVTRNLWDFGSVIWADGHSNGNYDPILHAVERYLETGDPQAWHVAYLMARHKVAHGLILCDAISEPHWGKWRYEKSVQEIGKRGRPGDQNLPAESHKWDSGVLLVATMSQDPDLLKAISVRKTQLLGSSPTVTHYGPRAWAWTLAGLWAYWVVQKDPALKARAQQEINRGIADLSRFGYWADDPNTGEWSPWQNAIALAQVAMWASAGVSVPTDRLLAVARLVLDRGTRFVKGGDGKDYLQAAMLMNRAPWQGQPQPDVWQGPVLTANVLPLCWLMHKFEPQRYSGHWDAAARTVAQPFRSNFQSLGMQLHPGEYQFDWTGAGFGAPKINSDWLLFARPRYFVA